ncbi:MAG TPA: hypothetical protein VFQ42_22365 [Mycobacterium sp.]|nr:hypothetical protein [Mycobacterium sp.]
MDFSHRLNAIRKGGQPGPSDVYVVPELTQLSVGFMQNPGSLIANVVAPSVKVATQSGKYIAYPRGYFFRDDMALRADGSESAGGGFSVDNTPQYFSDVWAWHTDMGPQVSANALNPVDLDRAATMLCTNKALIRREKLFLGKYFKTGVWTTELVGANSGGGGTTAANTLGWLDASALPIKAIKSQIKAFEQNSGYIPNVAIFSRDLWDIFCEHPNVISRVNAGQTPGGPAEISLQMVAGWLGIEKVVIARGVEATSAEGQADVMNFMATNGQLLLLYVAPAPSLFTPSALYSFDWIADGLVGTFGQTVARWYNQDRKATRYEIEMATDMKVVSADLGLLMRNFNV